MSAIASTPGTPQFAPMDRAAAVERVRSRRGPATVLEQGAGRIVTESFAEGVRVRVEVVDEGWAPAPTHPTQMETATVRNAQRARVVAEIVRAARTAADLFPKELR